MSKKNKISELKKEHNLENTKSIEEASKLLPSLSLSKFPGSVDIDIQITLKEKQKKESLKGSVSLPNTFGEEKKIIVFCDDKDVKTATGAGAVAAGLDKLMKDVEAGKVDFDVVIATAEVMPKIAKLGKVLGPKGLMPNPKDGTITKDIAKTIESFKSGKQNFKMEQGHGVIKSRVAMVDMKSEQIEENIKVFLKAVLTEARRLNSQPFKRILIKPTMGPIVKLDVGSVMEEIA